MMFWIDLYLFCGICFWVGFEFGLEVGWKYALEEVFKKLNQSQNDSPR